MVQTFKVTFKRMILDNESEWDDILVTIEQVYQCHNLKGVHSPYFLMYGKTARFPELEMLRGVTKKEHLEEADKA